MRREACGVTARRLLRWFPLQCTARSTLCHFLNLLLVELPTLRDQPSTLRIHKLQPTENGDHSDPTAKDHEGTIVSQVEDIPAHEGRGVALEVLSDR
jgi:hypothetical protein